MPSGTGLFSAWGMLHAPVRHDVSVPLHVSVDEATQRTLATEFEKLRARVQLLLERDGVLHADARYEASADMRYVGQEFFLNVDGTFETEPPSWESAFHQTYRRRHGHSRLDIPAEIVNLRVAGQGPELPRARSASVASAHRRPLERQIFLDGEFVTAEVIQRDDFVQPVAGPAIIEESASTTFVPPRWEAQLSSTDAIRLTRAES